LPGNELWAEGAVAGVGEREGGMQEAGRDKRCELGEGEKGREERGKKKKAVANPRFFFSFREATVADMGKRAPPP